MNTTTITTTTTMTTMEEEPTVAATTSLDTTAVVDDDNAISMPPISTNTTNKVKKRKRRHLRKSRMNDDDETEMKEEESYTFLGERISHEETPFWTSPILVSMYVIVLVSIVTRRLWVLQAILYILTACMAVVVYNWGRYIITNPELLKALASMRWYFGFAMRQAEATMEGGTTRQWLQGGAVAAYTSTSQTFLKWFCRQRSQHVNEIMMQQRQLNIDRLKQWQEKMKSFTSK